MKQIRFGITGSGYMGSTHAEAIRRLPNTTLAAVYGGRRAPGLAKQHNVPCEPDVASLVRRNDVDAIIVTTPHHLHVSETLQALEAGKHVLIEKPLATSVADCDRMIEAAARRKLTIGVGYQQRFRVNNAKAHELITQGRIGKVVAVQISMPMYAGAIKAGGFGGNWEWWNNPESLGHLLNAAPHAIDLVRWFTGADVVTVSAFSRTFLPGLPVEDTTMGMFELSSGAIGTLFSSRALPAPSFPGEDFRFRITGTTGLIDLDPYNEMKMADEKGWQVMSKQPTVGYEGANTAYGDVRMQAYCDQLASFVDRIEGKTGRVGSGPDGRAGVEACLAMLTSSKEKRWVQLGKS